MKLSLEKETLKKAFSKLKIALPDASINPTWEHFLFEVKKNSLIMKATDGQIAIVWQAKEFAGEDEFSFSLPGNVLSGLVSSLDDSSVSFEYNTETKDVTLTSGKFVWESVSGNVEQFPSVIMPTDLLEIKLPESFLTLVNSVYFSISNDLTKPDLNSLCIDVNKDGANKVCLVSTDRNRLGCVSFKSEFTDSLRLVLPKSSVSEMISFQPKVMMVGKDRDKVYFKSDDESGSYLFWTVLTNYAYPDIYAYLTSAFNQEKNIRIKRGEVIKSLKRIKMTSDKGGRSATLEFKADKIIVSSLNSQNKTKEEIAVEYEDKENLPMNLSVNLDYALEYLSTEIESDVNFKVIKGKCLIFDKDNYRHVLSINS
jgi:DNA polymerase III sliding clamp (beta) subunit (PCNA family)